MPHLDAAYNLARWLTRNEHDAEDVVQEAYLRAFKYFDGFHGGNGRAWLLTIVRRTCFTWLERNRPSDLVPFDEGAADIVDAREAQAGFAESAENPESHVMRNVDRDLLNQAIAGLPPLFREALVLRELQELSYKEIADVAGVPIGTVMSRLARARRLLKQALEPSKE
jgi:RNA polymerase sigma-70 factor (ECF subfamily)